MRFLFWLIAAPIVFGAASFAVSNRHSVEILIWPIPGTWDTPLYIVALGMLGVGFVLGAAMTWLSAVGPRLRAGGAARRIAALEQELALKEQTETETSADASSLKAASLPVPPPQGGLAKPGPAAT